MSEQQIEPPDVNVVPAAEVDIGLLCSKRAVGILQGGIAAPPGRRSNKYVTLLLGIMKEWPEWALRCVIADEKQPAGARMAASQVLLALKGDRDSFETVMDRTEGKTGADVAVIMQQALMLGLNVNPTVKKGVTPDELKAAYAAVEALKK